MKELKYIFFLLLLFFNKPASVQCENEYGFSLTAETGIIYGTSYEISYHGNSSQYTSELQWDIKPLWYVGLATEYGPKEASKDDGFFVNLELKVGIPGETGTMEDRDWLTPTTTPGSLTFFSSHDNYTKTAFLANIRGGYTIPLNEHSILKSYLCFSYMFYKFEASDGYIQYGANNHPPNISNPYGPWNKDWAKDYTKGVGIAYSQHWFYLAPGLEIAFALWKFDFAFSFSASPLVFSFTKDNHFQRIPPFEIRGFLFGRLYPEPKGSFSCNFNKFFSLDFTVAYRFIKGARGDFKQKEFYSTYTTTTTYNDIAGAAYKAFDISTSFNIAF
jgi:outer membrane protease